MKSRFTSRTPWRAKLEKPQVSKVCAIPPRMQKRLGAGTLLIPRPLDVDGTIRRARKGQLITVIQIREALAKQFGADTTCPLCTGIFIRIAAEAAEEDARNSTKTITPYWRVVGGDGKLNPKFPGGVKAQAKRLRAEGHRITPARGKQPPRVKGFERNLIKL